MILYTELFTILVAQNYCTDVSVLHKIRQSTDIGALKMGHIWSGMMGFVLRVRDHPAAAKL